MGVDGLMTKIPLASSDYRRKVPKIADVLLRNRYVEQDPVLNAGLSYIARPGLRFWQAVGDGPMRKTFSQPGAFEDDLFVVSFNTLYRIARATGVAASVFTGLQGGDEKDAVRMAATGDIGIIPPRLWIADGRVLYVYDENGFASGHLTATAVVATNTVVLGTMHYEFTAGSVDAGTPAGTLANPWLVKLGGSLLVTFTNLLKAINGTGVPGTDFSTALVTNNLAVATSASGTGLYARAIPIGGAGNTVVTTAAGSDLAWGAGTMTGGGTAGVIQVPVPDEIGVLDVAVINNFVIVIPAQGEGVNGRFYWVQPGETVIDPLDYATAERSADPIYQCVVFNDQFWLPGQNTTEVWFLSGDPDAPMSRLQGVVFDRGTISGSAIQIKDFMVMIDNDGGVFKIQGGETRISTPDIEERLRKANNLTNILRP